MSLPALLHLEKVFFQFAAGHPGFLPHFIQKQSFESYYLQSFWCFALSAFTVAHGIDSGGSFCTDDFCKLHVTVSVTKAFYMIGLLALCKTPKPGGPVDCSLSGP